MLRAVSRRVSAHGIARPPSSSRRILTRSRPDSSQPGHVFPLQGETQAASCGALDTPRPAIDLARLAGLDPAAVVCEILNEDGLDGSLAPAAESSRRNTGCKICCIQDLIAYRRKREKLVEREQTVSLPTDYGDFELHLYRSTVDERHHLALVEGHDRPSSEPTLVRVHSECLTGDVFASKRCDCGSQLHQALRTNLRRLATASSFTCDRKVGGIGLAPKIHAYKLQEARARHGSS